MDVGRLGAEGGCQGGSLITSLLCPDPNIHKQWVLPSKKFNGDISRYKLSILNKLQRRIPRLR